MNRSFGPLMALLSGTLMWLAWPPLHTSFIAFAGLIPLLMAEDAAFMQSGRRGGFIWNIYLGILVWNIFTTWWIWYASPEGAIMAIVLNSLLLTLPWLFYRITKRRSNRYLGYITLVGLSLGVEYLHLNWDAPWPWLNLGNVFATMPDWVQWYEYTGAAGGSLWVWALNILIYEAAVRPWLKERISGDKAGINYKAAAIAVLLIALPVALSYGLKPEEEPLDSKGNIVAVQPNIDPYNDKFDRATFEHQLKQLISLSESQINDRTELVLWPETSIPGDMDEASLGEHYIIQQIREFLKRHPHVKLISGGTTYTVFAPDAKKTNTARYYAATDVWFDVFNAALLLDTGRDFRSYHKMKLVPGVEKMPYPGVFGFLQSYAIAIGGTSGSLGSSDSVAVFRINDELSAAPVICYESIFGEFVSNYVRRGANVICIITNDGWWKNTNGYRQHLHYATLRALETRKFVARSANTGISCFITPTGRMLSETAYWEPAAIRSGYSTDLALTFYTQHGDYIYRIFTILGFIALFSGIFINYLTKKRS